MGFGQLFIGYFFLIFFPLSRIDTLPNIAIIGCIIMLFGLRRITYYCSDNRAFSIAKILGVVLSAVSIAAFMLDIAGLDGKLNNVQVDSILSPVSDIVYALLIVSFTVALFIGVHKLSLEVELPKLAKKSTFLISLSAVYLLAEIFAGVFSIVHTYSAAPSEGFTTLTVYLWIVAFLLSYLILFFNLRLIFSCYARICLEGDEDMPFKSDLFDKIIAWKNRNKK